MIIEPSELMRFVFDEHVAHYGEPDIHFRFDSHSAINKPVLDYLDIFVWRPTIEIPMTTFSTMGMAEKAMNGCPHRCEIHWTIRGSLSEQSESDVATFLANIATWPFLKNNYFDYWHLLPDVGLIPQFSNCESVIFHPAFKKGGWDQLMYNDLTVKLLNLIPITTAEKKLSIEAGIGVLLDRMYDQGVDIFKDRQN
ncbi:suppressor of fused domain protein [bacterium]|nr:suppressor of fused domain protein [bacterium]